MKKLLLSLSLCFISSVYAGDSNFQLKNVQVGKEIYQIIQNLNSQGALLTNLTVDENLINTYEEYINNHTQPNTVELWNKIKTDLCKDNTCAFPLFNHFAVYIILKDSNNFDKEKEANSLSLNCSETINKFKNTNINENDITNPMLKVGTKDISNPSKPLLLPYFVYLDEAHNLGNIYNCNTQKWSEWQDVDALVGSELNKIHE